MQDLAALQAFAIPGQLSFRSGPGGLLFADIENSGGMASVCMQGAHCTTFCPKAQTEPMLWLSEAARFAQGRSIRGGVPICWPWFGAHPTEAAFPAHGFARTVAWDVIDSGGGQGVTELWLRLPRSDIIPRQWPHDTPVDLCIRVADTLEIALTTRNVTAIPLSVSEAFHAYFFVGDIAEVELDGLRGCTYLDKTEGFARKRQDAPLRFGGEIDRVYVNAWGECAIVDSRLRRRIRIAKQGSASTVVWSPGHDKAAALGDFTPTGWRNMLCVESANAADDILTLNPGCTHRLAVRYSVERA
jgi:D-hexose-6-phosphate mutarotase